jgi:3-hydroxyacyl-[acyl-carrier-protein] dehydratase
VVHTNPPGMNCSLEIAPDHPSFPGHFPGFPVLPGAVLLDEAMFAIQRDRGIDLKEWWIASVKFLQGVRPGDALRMRHAPEPNGQIRFTIHCGDRIVAAGALSRSLE